MIIKNKKAFFEYFIVEKYTAGIVLHGTEIKSAREGKVSLTDSFCQFINNELFVKNMHISEYENGNIWNHIPKRDRKLLLQKNELRRLQKGLLGTGMTIIPLTVFINNKGLLKLEIGLAKGKKIYDKRETIKQRDLGRNND
jgi:SsrA-binding protein